MIVNVPHPWELHCHSTFSDGQLTCPELFAAALERGVTHMALTDHDTAKGYRTAIEQQWLPEGFHLYPATELSCVWRGRTVHIVGLNIDAYSEAWMQTESDYENRRELRFQRILQLLRKAGFNLDEQAIRASAEPAAPARPHIANYLVQTEQVKSIGSVYKRWLGQGKVGDVKQQWPELAEAVASIRAAGGMAVIAHPHRYKLTWTKARELMDDFAEAGGQAIEIACVGMHPQMRDFLAEQARARGLYVSGGSDFHSPKTNWLKLGLFPDWPKDVLKVTDWLLEQS